MTYKYSKCSCFPCAADVAFRVVLDVEKYPEFIPWCRAVHIKEMYENVMIVDLIASFYGISGQYTSKVTYSNPNSKNPGWIRAESQNGVFEHLYTKWQFTHIKAYETMVSFYMDFKLKSPSLAILLNSMYEYAQDAIISAFYQRIEKTVAVINIDINNKTSG